MRYRARMGVLGLPQDSRGCSVEYLPKNGLCGCLLAALEIIMLELFSTEVSELPHTSAMNFVLIDAPSVLNGCPTSAPQSLGWCVRPNVRFSPKLPQSSLELPPILNRILVDV